MAKKMGRPTLYKGEETDKLVYKLSLLGLTDEEMANALEIRVSTFNQWKRMYPLFAESLKKGKDIADSNVVTKLYTRSIGYEYEEVTTETNPKTKVVKRKTTIKHVPPDTTAQIFWLKNRRPDLWRDRREITGKDGSDLVKASEVDISQYTKEEKEILRKIGENFLNDKK